MNKQKFFSDKVILITGASSGIGEALARELINLNAFVVLTGRRLERLEKTIQDLNISERALAVKVDVQNLEDLQTALQKTLEKFGKLDGIIANAGFVVSGNFEHLSMDDFKRQFDVNVWGLVQSVSVSLPEIKKTKGFIALLGSINSYLSFSGISAYAMSKYSVRALGEALYHEMKKENVSVTTICPGLVESEIRKVDNKGRYHAEGRESLPSWIILPARKAARQILRAVAARKREVVVTWHGKILVWLQRHFPHFFHWLVDILKVKAGKHKSLQAQNNQ